MDPEVAATQVRQEYDVWARTRAVAYDQLPGQYDVDFHQANMDASYAMNWLNASYCTDPKHELRPSASSAP
ncbi:uncharacterized protein ACA1_087430 [Acanthamoeba castellanii str. Neff]|uniref:Uncharacterized protein n=1 Tax=Acanthamoeba castellanii (strain ATCC 30010 / Neff) TaxID=1257118 RepID=L8GWU8_ACACF|nr:uncharacterized protein ACA1_087430 [Acanthamoeba castellanii str. Neff]ELR16561.1 hypothetical protein ACA1_087430 [Acanthamoeba castellanii str. Neff]